MVSIWNIELGNRPLVYPFSKGKFKILGLLNANAFVDINNNLIVKLFIYILVIHEIWNNLK